MAITSYQGWVNNGKPASSSTPIRELALNLKAHGYNIGRTDVIGLGDDRHLQATVPEDHTPYSHTPWPNAQPYPHILAVDIMEPVPAGMPSLVRLGEKLLADRLAGRPELGWLKYMNRPLAGGGALHESWKPTHATTTTTDKGHIHISARTDGVFSTAAALYDPVAELLSGTQGDDMTPEEHRMLYNLDRLHTALGSGTDRVTKIQLQNGTFIDYTLKVPTAAAPPAPVVLTPEDRAAIVADLKAELVAAVPSADQIATAVLDAQAERLAE